MKPLFNKDRSINLPGYVITQEVAPGMIRRLGAFLIDVYVCIVILMVPFTDMFVTRTFTLDDLMSQAALPPATYIATMFFLFMFFAYQVLTQYAFGQTLGMMVMRYSARTRTGPVLRLWQACVRNLYVFPLLPLSIVWAVDIGYMIMFGERLLERLSATRVSSTLEMPTLA